MRTTTPEFDARKLRIPSEVKALLSALQLSNPDTTLLANFSDAEWTRLLAFCDLAQLTLPLAQLRIKEMPLWVGERLAKNLADNALRFERVKATYREAAHALESAGLQHVVIKGFTQAPDYVADPRLRPQSDLDIFCPPESIDAAYRACEAIGYLPSGAKISYARADHQPALVRLGNWKWRGNLYDPEMPLSIELHFCLWNESDSHIPVPGTELFWNRRTTREVDGLSFSCLSPVDHLAHFTLHILRNLFLQEWIIRHVLELAFFLHSHADDEHFWENWKETHPPLLRTYAAIAFYYAHTWFGCRLHPQAAHEIDRLPAKQRSWLRYFSGSAMETMFGKNKDFFWLQLSMLSSRKEKLRIVSRTFVPARSIGSINSAGVYTRNKRPLQPKWSPILHYVDYLISQSAEHIRADLVALGRTLRWSLSEKDESPKISPAKN